MKGGSPLHKKRGIPIYVWASWSNSDRGGGETPGTGERPQENSSSAGFVSGGGAGDCRNVGGVGTDPRVPHFEKEILFAARKRKKGG